MTVVKKDDPYAFLNHNAFIKLPDIKIEKEKWFYSTGAIVFAPS